MTPTAIIREAAADGVSLALSSAGTIKATGDQAAVNCWLPVLRERKSEILAVLAYPAVDLIQAQLDYQQDLAVFAEERRQSDEVEAELARLSAIPQQQGAHPDPLWWRIAITKAGARTVEIDTPSGWTLADWQAYADCYRGHGCAVTPIAGLPKPRAPANLDEVLRTACDGVAGISPAQFRSLLSPEDIKDVEAGAIHTKTLHAYALSFAEGIRSGRIAALPERKGAKPAPLWGSVAITEAKIDAARKGRTAVRQGDFTGAPEVKP